MVISQLSVVIQKLVDELSPEEAGFKMSFCDLLAVEGLFRRNCDRAPFKVQKLYARQGQLKCDSSQSMLRCFSAVGCGPTTADRGSFWFESMTRRRSVRGADRLKCNDW
jgi:hypothetical protein